MRWTFLTFLTKMHKLTTLIHDTMMELSIPKCSTTNIEIRTPFQEQSTLLHLDAVPPSLWGSTWHPELNCIRNAMEQIGSDQDWVVCKNFSQNKIVLNSKWSMHQITRYEELCSPEWWRWQPWGWGAPLLHSAPQVALSQFSPCLWNPLNATAWPCQQNCSWILFLEIK